MESNVLQNPVGQSMYLFKFDRLLLKTIGDENWLEKDTSFHSWIPANSIFNDSVKEQSGTKRKESPRFVTTVFW